MKQARSNITNDQYTIMVETATPPSKTAINCLKAFLVGGTICALAEVAIKLVQRAGMPRDDATTVVAIGLIAIATLLTAVGLYCRLGAFAGAGSFVPITGFANAVAAPAIEYKREGYVLGVGAKMFAVAGPVIVYGTAASVLVGLIYYFVG